MKKIIFILSLLALPVCLLAQDHKRWSIGIDGKLGSGQIAVFDYVKPQFCYTGGIKVGYEVIKQLPVSIGFSYYKINAQTQIIDDMHNNMNYDYNSDIYAIPLKVGYYIDLTNIRVFANVGAIGLKPNTKFSSNTNYEYNWSFGYLGELGAGYKFGNVMVSAAIEYMSTFKTVTPKHDSRLDHIFDTYPKPYFFGGGLGLTYYF